MINKKEGAAINDCLIDLYKLSANNLEELNVIATSDHKTVKGILYKVANKLESLVND